MDKWSRRTFISKKVKGTAGICAISVLPIRLTVYRQGKGGYECDGQLRANQ